MGIPLRPRSRECEIHLHCVQGKGSKTYVDISYAASQAHRIVNVALTQEHSPGIVFIFSQGRKDIYHV
jgi:hypothetical protein